MLLTALTLATSLSLPPGTVVAGVSTHNGTHTDVTAFLPDGSSRVLFVEEHAAGIVPKGTLAADASHVALAVQHDGADGATVVVHALNARNERRVAGERAIASQAPRIDIASSSVTWVRAAEKRDASTFDVVTAPLNGANEEVRASIEGAWLSPLGNQRFVHITTEGAHRVVALRGTSLDVVRELGKGPMRLPAFLDDGSAIVERKPKTASGRSALVALARESEERIVREGIAGMDPLVVVNGAGDVVAGAGTKRAALVVVRAHEAKHRVIDLGRAGVATPLAATQVGDELVVVARLDRGRALPGETWMFDKRGARALVTSGVVEVYGIVAAGGAR